MNKFVTQLLTATTTGTITLLLSFAGSAQAAIIDFESLPNGTTTPTDNNSIPSYQVNGTTVTFGFDTNNDLTIDFDALFESRTDQKDTGLAYVYRSDINGQEQPDFDATSTNVGGNWLLRNSENLNLFDLSGKTKADFIIHYTGTAVRSTSGQIWDVDAAEKFQIDALDGGGNVISSITTPDVPSGEGPDTFNGLPLDFSFSNLDSDIGYIRISGISHDGGGGYGFDNFSVEPVPEPLTILGSATALGFGCLLKRQHSQKQKKDKQSA